MSLRFLNDPTYSGRAVPVLHLLLCASVGISTTGHFQESWSSENSGYAHFKGT